MSALVLSSWGNFVVGRLVWPAGERPFRGNRSCWIEVLMKKSILGSASGNRRKRNQEERAWERGLGRRNCQELAICWSHRDPRWALWLHFIFLSVFFVANYHLLMASLILWLLFYYLIGWNIEYMTFTVISPVFISLGRGHGLGRWGWDGKLLAMLQK